MEQEGFRKAKAFLVVSAMTSFFASFGGSAMSLSVPNISAEFQVSAAAIGWIITSYIMANAALSLPFGKIADMYGRRKVFLVGIIGFVLSAFLCAASVSFPMLIVGRVLMGIFAAMIFSTNNAILISVYPPTMRGQVLGISIAFVYLGLSCGPVVGGFINHYIGWRAILVITAVTCLIAFVLGIKNTPKDAITDVQEKIDLPGNILFVIGICLTLYGLTDLSVLSIAKYILIAGLVVLVLFVLVERKLANPLMKVTMFTKSRTFTFSNLAALLNYGATYAISYTMSIYLQVVKGLDSQIAGIIMISMPLMQAIFTPIMGKKSDHIAPHKLATSGMAICVASLIGLALIGVATPIVIVIAILAVAGFSFALFSSPNTNAVMSSVNKEDYASANSILATMRTVGQCSSMAIVTIVVGRILGQVSLEQAGPDQLVHVLHVTFIVFVVLCLIGVIFSTQRKERV